MASNFVGSSDTSDVYSFRLASAKDINLALTGMSADADVRLYKDANNNGVIDSGDPLIGSSTYGSNHDEAINAGSQAAGNYLVQVYRFSGDTKYDLRLSATNDYAPSNILSSEVEVGNLSGTRTFTDWVGTTDTADVYHLIVNSAGTFTLNMTGLSSDADVRLVQDSNSNSAVDPGEVIASSTYGGSANESITASLTPGDNYFVQVYQYSGDTNYNIAMSFA
ncbi:pre-peptidase C-terminal domain-containing protein [Kamptonema formosum]|uniref:pre-peptidase C-terminal domain-containing protein n=1 Tax=Kamptonema formosum TaxID=331992 RepID=UPI001E63EDB8|nr:pre-peptidase C-terminal domain-containing protein [Oscillatoria sp. PCC 10802]